MAYQLSDNGLKAVTEIGRWVMAAIAVVALWIQQHNQHDERIAVMRETAAEQGKTLKAIETKLDNRRPVVFGKE